MMEIKIEDKHRINIDTFGKLEVERVEKALEDAKKRLSELKSCKVLTKEKTLKISELKNAIYIGKMYLDKLKVKWGY